MSLLKLLLLLLQKRHDEMLLRFMQISEAFEDQILFCFVLYDVDDVD